LANAILKETKSVTLCIISLNRLHLSIFDMAVRQPDSHEAVQNMNISVIFNIKNRNIYLLERPLDQGSEWGHGLTAFSHSIGEYGTGFYIYQL
jgi:metallopeptidase MepB